MPRIGSARDGVQWTRGQRNARCFALAVPVQGSLAMTAMRVRTRWYRSTAPSLGERSQPIIFFGHPEQTPLILDCIGSKFPGSLGALPPVIRIGHEIDHRSPLELVAPSLLVTSEKLDVRRKFGPIGAAV